jgi:hypothetical protein
LHRPVELAAVISKMGLGRLDLRRHNPSVKPRAVTLHLLVIGSCIDGPGLESEDPEGDKIHEGYSKKN